MVDIAGQRALGEKKVRTEKTFLQKTLFSYKCQIDRMVKCYGAALCSSDVVTLQIADAEKLSNLLWDLLTRDGFGSNDERKHHNNPFRKN